VIGVELPAIRAAAAPVGGFPLLAVLVYVADEHPAFEAGTGRSRQVCPQQRGARMACDGTSGLQISLLSETHSSGATRREKPLLLTAPVRLKVPSTVVGDWGPTTSAGVDRVDFIVVSVVALEGDLLTAW
jgi:hypothetical protein